MAKSTIRCATDEVLSAYLDKDLDEARTDDVRRHLKTCVDCREAIHDLQQIRQVLGAIPAEEVSPEVWSRIARAQDDASEPQPRRRGMRLAWIAAATAAAASFLAVLFVQDGTEQGKNTTMDRPDSIDAVVAVQRAESAYREAIDALESAVHNEKPEFEPETMAIVTESLHEVEAAIDRSRRAVKRDPGNVEAVRTLLAAYQEKVDLLTELLEQRI